jgi:dCTP diphosphatase
VSDDSVTGLTVALRAFAAERDWDQFHTPKNLACALSVEAAELLEHFQWLPDSAPSNVLLEKQELIAQELGDVLLYLVRLSDKLGVDLIEAAVRKLRINAEKYPVDRARGSSKKYSEL